MFHEIRYLNKIQEYDGVYTFHFKHSISYEAGMYVHLIKPETQGALNGDTVRHMSFSSAPSDPHLTFTMDTASNTPFKAAMLKLSPGDNIELFKIKLTLQTCMGNSKG